MHRYAPVAQLDRASDSGSEGWGFESLQADHVGASVISLAPTFFQESERAHVAAPPFRIGPASLGFDLVLGANLEAAASILL